MSGNPMNSSKVRESIGRKGIVLLISTVQDWHQHCQPVSKEAGQIHRGDIWVQSLFLHCAHQWAGPGFLGSCLADTAFSGYREHTLWEVVWLFSLLLPTKQKEWVIFKMQMEFACQKSTVWFLLSPEIWEDLSPV